MAEVKRIKIEHLCCAKETKRLQEFCKKHKRCARATAIGGQYIYQLCQTSIGTMLSVKCVCGKEKDITDYKNW